MHLEPRLLVDVDTRRRERVLARASEVLTLTRGSRHPARREERWRWWGRSPSPKAAGTMPSAPWRRFGDEGVRAQRRSEFLVTAADIVVIATTATPPPPSNSTTAPKSWPHNPGLPGVNRRPD